MHGRRLELATRPRGRDRSFPQTLSGRGERRLHSATRFGCLHSREERIEFWLSVSSVASAAPDKALKLSTEIRTALGASCFVITTAPPWMAMFKTRPNSLFASVAVTDDGSSVTPRLFR